MDKVQAEAILELTEAYDYGALRRAWRKLCADYHPDKCVATGMDRTTADEVLKDINEAFYVLKPLVETGETVEPGSRFSRGGQYARGVDDSAFDAMRARLYDSLVLELLAAKTAADYADLANRFSLLGDYRDARTIMQTCALRAVALRQEEDAQTEAENRERAERWRKQEYAAAVQGMASANSAWGYDEYVELAKRFSALGNYKDARTRAEALRGIAAELRRAQGRKIGAEEERKQRASKRAQYEDLARRLPFARTVQDYVQLAEGFDRLCGFMDSDGKAKGCWKRATGLLGFDPRVYGRAVREYSEARTPYDVGKLAEQFESMGFYKDAPDYARKCSERLSRMMETALNRSGLDRVEMVYLEAIKAYVNAETAGECSQSMRVFQSLGDYSAAKSWARLAEKRASRLRGGSRMCY